MDNSSEGLMASVVELMDVSDHILVKSAVLRMPVDEGMSTATVSKEKQ